MTGTYLKLRGVSKTFLLGKREIHALVDLTIEVRAGECLAIVGESGSGKSTIANLILGIFAPSSGSILLNGEELPQKRQLQHRRSMQLVQQNPLTSLNPKRTIGASLRLPLDVHSIGSGSERRTQVGRLLEEVGLDKNFAGRAPLALSGGQLQRVAIARALACNSELVVLDEPTSALDVLVQARVLRLLQELREARGLTYIFITHDLAVVRNIADRVAVMKEGRLVELARTTEIFRCPSHEYTRGLIAACPVITDEEQRLRDDLRNQRVH